MNVLCQRHPSHSPSDSAIATCPRRRVVNARRPTRKELSRKAGPLDDCVRMGCARRKGKDGTDDRTAVLRDADPSPRHQPPCDATYKRRGEHMARLKRLVGITLAVVIAAALVIYVLRPTASPGPSSLVGNDTGTTTGHP